MSVKRSIFNKPSWAAKASVAVQDDQPIFQSNCYEEIVEANKKRKEQRIARQKEKEERKRKSASHETKTDNDKHDMKKQRLSTESVPVHEHDDENDHIPETYRSSSEADTGSESASGSIRSVGSRTAGSKKNGIRRKAIKSSSSPVQTSHMRSAKTVKPCTNSDDDFAIIEVAPASQQQKTNSKPQPPPPLPPPSDSDSDPEDDEYVKGLKRAARAAARKKREAQNLKSAGTDGRPPSVPPPGSYHAQDGASTRYTPDPAAPDLSDPEVTLRIKTIIPHCDEMFIKRRASQTLGLVIDAFIKKHQLSDQLSKKVFFTWNLNPLTRYTTMRSVLTQIKHQHGTNPDGSDKAYGRIELEAMTEEIYKHRIQQKEREKKALENGEEYTPIDYQDANLKAVSNNAVVTAENVEAEAPKEGIVLVLKSNDEATLPLMKLRVRPHTNIAKIVSGYKKKQQLDPSREIYLVFDGDRLTDEQTVDDIGFEGDDVVEIKER